MRLPSSWLLLLPLALPPPAGAILLDSGNGNTSPPADDPGWVHVGELAGLNAVYLGYGWAITAAHVSVANPATFDGVAYPIQPGTGFILTHDGVIDADVKVFRMDPTEYRDKADYQALLREHGDKKIEGEFFAYVLNHLGGEVFMADPQKVIVMAPSRLTVTSSESAAS